jgi:hypothetical protein
LVRGFNEREIRVKRRTCVVSENLLKLVKNPRDVATFLPVLMPLLSRCEKEVRSVRGHYSLEKKNTHYIQTHNSRTQVADPECRDRCSKAINILKGLEKRMNEKPEEEEEEKDDDSEDVLCDTTFSLAYVMFEREAREF